MQDLNDLYYYAEVVEHGGFSAAARVLGLPKSKLSRRLALLEERLGVRLIQRSTRRFAVTDVGRTYYEHCKAMLEEARAAQESIDLTRAEPRGVVRITCPVALLQTTVSSMLADFMASCPLVTIHLESTNRQVDLVAEAIDIAIRVRPPPLQDSDLVLKVLGNRCQCLVASPELIAQQGAVSVPADLSGWPSLGLGQPQQEFIWRLDGPEGAHAAIYHQPRLVTADMTTLRSAAQRGVGAVQLPVMMVAEQLAEGSLIRLLPAWSLRHEIIHAVFPSRRGLLPSVRSVLDYLALRFSQLDDR
ncbi:LysR family transcriptional regulator [Yersinia aleksiciae]|uniref:LysR family transcriptional regulator n=1 Tax=Yersinia aleksiciae TaxID=263819 RepID=A0A0T9TAH7_YERAE|nr:LysR family transcriptional regulator [Yersinia aleksiciae]MDA5496984.1 LysR family transcriptional regulator [Yersinia aleksiciae]NIK98634.1 LysR family transcriptional regulator [Yersinia aleksiciae]WQC72446.1 LysR family transcriptional regulator [Yersinia aleksiciae]CFQ33163.1 LysR family transcriptional regulator [Yersinia aleksiciae]CNK71083.1 LysR family transcriptional regulator [Yersinia aleksiciae]